MVLSEVIPYIAPLVGLFGVFFAIETRQEKRGKKLMDDIAHMIDSKIGEYANRVNSERMQSLERENERLKEYARDKK